MNEEREKVRCQSCELVQSSDQAKCRRCRSALPEPIVKVVERVVEKVVIRHDPQCFESLDEARKLILAATQRLTQKPVEGVAAMALVHVPETEVFPTMAEAERKLILAAYQRSNRRPLEAARLLGIGKTTFYRKLRDHRSGGVVTSKSDISRDSTSVPVVESSVEIRRQFNERWPTL